MSHFGSSEGQVEKGAGGGERAASRRRDVSSGEYGETSAQRPSIRLRHKVDSSVLGALKRRTMGPKPAAEDSIVSKKREGIQFSISFHRSARSLRTVV